MNKLRIFHYDFADIVYSSFFIKGFLENQKQWKYDFRISKAIPRPVLAMMNDPFYWPISSKMCIFEVRTSRSRFFFCVDTHDSNRSILCGGGPGYGLPLMKHIRYYFKVNYNEKIIDNDPNLQPFRNSILPTPICFPVGFDRPWIILKSIIRPSERPRSLLMAKKGFDVLINTPGLGYFRNLREFRKTIDVFFVNRAYGSRHQGVDDFRRRIIDKMRNSKDITGIAGFSRVMGKTRNQPLQIGAYGCGRYRRRKYLKNLARARVGIYVRGTHNCISFKLGELLALGLPIVGQPIANNRKIFYADSEWSKQFRFETVDEIITEVRRLLKSPSELTKLGEMNRRIFDNQFAPKAVVADILRKVL